MNQTIRLDTRKREGKFGEARIAPLRRGERNNVLLTVKVCANGQPYDLSGKTTSLVATTAAGKLVGPYPMEAAEAGIARIVLPAALYSAVGAFIGYIEIRDGETLVDTTDLFVGNVLDCIDADGEQAEEYKPLIGEVEDAIAKALESRIIHAEAETLDPGSDATASLVTEDGAQCMRLGIPRGDTGAKGDKGDPFTYDDFTDAQIAELQRPATEAAADAKATIAEVKATEAKLYPAAENILVGSETGTVAHVEDAFAGASMRKITVEGACKQDGIPSHDAPKPITVVENPVLKVTGRNLIDVSLLIAGYSVDSNDGHIYTTSTNKWHANVDFMDASPMAGKQVAASGLLAGKRTNFLFYDSDEKYISYYGESKETFVFNVPENAELMRVDMHADVYGHGTASLELAPASGSYKPYTSQTLTFALPQEHPYLAKLPDGTADEIVVDEEGNVELVARVLQIKVPNGGFTWFIQEQQGGFSLGYTERILGLADIKKKLDAAALMCDKFRGESHWENTPCFGVSEVLWVVPRTNQGDITSEDVAAVANGMTFYAPLAEEARYQLGKIEMPKAQDNIVNAWTDAEVTPRTGIEYTRDVNIVVANLESAIASITEG